MVAPETIQIDLERGWGYYLDLSVKEYEKAQSGCGCCGNKLWPCLYSILNSLQWRVDNNVYDDTTDKLYSDMISIIGG